MIDEGVPSRSRDGKELTEFHSNSQIVVEVAEESRICRFGEKIRKYEIDIYICTGLPAYSDTGYGDTLCISTVTVFWP